MQEKRGRKVFSRGIWASAATVERIRADLAAERSTESFAKKKEADARRREKVQAKYVEDWGLVFGTAWGVSLVVVLGTGLIIYLAMRKRGRTGLGWLFW